MTKLYNMMEEAVKIALEDYIRSGKSQEICTCDECKRDVMALMLNALPPYYVNTDKGALYTKLNEFDPQYKVNILIALTEAISKVKARPRHEIG